MRWIKCFLLRLSLLLFCVFTLVSAEVGNNSTPSGGVQAGHVLPGVKTSHTARLLDRNQTRPPTRPRVLVITIGNVRGGIFAWESLRRFVLEPLRAHLMVVVGVKPEEAGKVRETHLVQLARYYVPIIEPEDWSTVLDRPMHGQNGSGPITNWQKLCAVSAGGNYMGGIRSKACQHQRSRSAAQLGLRWVTYEHLVASGLYLDYDYFVLTRTDYMYVCKLRVSSLNPKYVWNQKCGRFGGYSDRVTIVSRENILTILKWPMEVTQFPDEWEQKYRNCHINNFEMSWMCYIENAMPNMTRFFIHPAVIVAHQNDTSTWSKKTYLGDFKVPFTFVKTGKEEEWYEAKKICNVTHFYEMIKLVSNLTQDSWTWKTHRTRRDHMRQRKDQEKSQDKMRAY
eukprot:gb/GEZN01009535.1/.p1 GENE.gb/GEZN01009535.1/~~gb/GEZN01009535.1/.p1  ORF type:complete len:396 (+),score=15.94 gb/GEZN01009535.1/:79-1266(+)